jgi:glucose-6-phosphate isomerase
MKVAGHSSPVIFVVATSIITNSAHAWSPANLLQIGRRRSRQLIKKPVPISLRSLAEQSQRDTSSFSLFAQRFDDIDIEQKRNAQEDIPSEAPTFIHDDLSVSDDENVNNLKVPQIHLPPRLKPNVGWEHHHRATTQFVHGRLARRKSNDDTDYEQEDEEDVLISASTEWKNLEGHKEEMETSHLGDLLQDSVRSDAMFAEHDGVYLDYSRQRATLKTLDLLQDLSKRQQLKKKIQAMFSGEKINFTEKRAVLHTALRADRSEEVYVDGQNVIEEVHEVLDQIKTFTEGVRSGSISGYTGKRLRNIISVGIGGSYLGPEFLHEVMKTEPEGINSALGYSLRFLANVDPVDAERICADLDPEETLIIIVSKTFTTAETMLNARTMRQWLWDFMGNDKEVVRKHVVACASVSATKNVQEFGIDTEKYFFRFWDWVGGRYSVCSAAGAVPISLLYGYNLFEKFLKVRIHLYFFLLLQ